MDDPAYTVGALAKASGLTVRTLHHWDAIGLLAPAERAGNGYRRYGAAEVARLYRILALRRLGLSLEEVAAVLEREGPGSRPRCARTCARRGAARRDLGAARPARPHPGRARLP